MTEHDRLLANLGISSDPERAAVLDVLAFITERLALAELPGMTAVDPTTHLGDELPAQEIPDDER